MYKRNFWLILFIIAGSSTSLFLHAKAAPVEGCITAQCHPAMLKAKVVHPAAKSCDDCHQSQSSTHPQKGKKTFKLAEEGGKLCKMCHSEVGAGKIVHDPVKSGECTACHDPHESNEARLLVKPKEKLCAECHMGMTDKNYIHGPAAVGDCIVCHSPHASDNKALAVRKGNDLCFTCHGTIQNQLKKKVVHAALEEGCASCHNPHGSSHKKLLSAEGENLCFQCHSDIRKRVQESKTPHAPIKSAGGCASCHSPHASDGEKLLQKAGSALCLDCHKGVLKKGQTNLHGPINESKCSPCHDPHGSPNTKLLVKGFPDELYVPYTENAYPLCFSCHNRDLLRYPDTSYATGFRDGEKNLHFIHVNQKEKGRSCKTCHGMHASENPKLVMDKVPFTKWDLPVKFMKTETGGSCAPGCHKKYNYDRKNPGKEPEPAKTKEPAKPKRK